MTTPFIPRLLLLIATPSADLESVLGDVHDAFVQRIGREGHATRRALVLVAGAPLAPRVALVFAPAPFARRSRRYHRARARRADRDARRLNWMVAASAARCWRGSCGTIRSA